jgi:hypothetical protein
MLIALETYMDRPLHLRIIVFYRNGQWIAQCLEHDISVRTKDFDTLQARMEAALRKEQYAHRSNGKQGLEDVPSCPLQFFDMWNERSIFNELGKVAQVSYEMALYVEDPAIATDAASMGADDAFNLGSDSAASIAVT